MNSKPLIWIGMFVGSLIGSYVPAIWGAGFFSFSSIIFGAIGGAFGILIGFKLSQW
ncbi:hypothetical protein GW896_00940 [Candidatus Kuenenbacteria bacterium]|nr:hypothetical protein [Candidatus Kuenenbacteria bacterium]